MVNKLRHVGIVVGDGQEAIKWYGELFNYYPLVFESVEIEGSWVHIAKLAHKDGTILELLDGATARPHISLSVNHLEFEAFKKEHDAEIFEKDGVCYIQDPWGNLIEIVEEI